MKEKKLYLVRSFAYYMTSGLNKPSEIRASIPIFHEGIQRMRSNILDHRRVYRQKATHLRYIESWNSCESFSFDKIIFVGQFQKKGQSQLQPTHEVNATTPTEKGAL